MSDANDDLLSYELGDDLDDQELAADEDALLLSDEEAQLDFEEDLRSDKEIPTTSTQISAPRIEENQHHEEEIEAPAEDVHPEQVHEEPYCQSTVEDVGHNDEECVSSSNDCPKDSEPESINAPPDSIASDASSKRSLKEDLDYSSFDNDDEPRERHNPKTTSEREQQQQLQQQNNSDDFRNRNHPNFQRGRGGRGGGGPPFRGGRFGRGGYNNIQNPGGPPNQFYPKENFNPINGAPPPPGHGGNVDYCHQGPGPGPMPPQMMGGNRMPGPPGPMMHRPQGPPGMRPDFRPNMNMQQGNFGRPPFPNDVRPMMRPPYDMQSNPQQQPPPRFNNNGGPMNVYRPHIGGGPPVEHGGPRGPMPRYPGNNFGPNNFNRMHAPQQQFGAPQQMAPYQQPPQRPPMMNRAPMHPQMGGGGGGGGGGAPMPMGPLNVPSVGLSVRAPVGGMAPILPRKVLINPNFKGGGVEAATNQLMKDTLGGAQLMPSAMSDEALLRQQEEFINKNRMHIEKRRHDRSPEPRKRDYSPPLSHRDSRPHGGGGGARHRRGHSPTSYRESGRSSPKRRRSMDGPMTGSGVAGGASTTAPAPDPDEDEETRAYRLKIEKQKAMRDKILRDKEMRRRKAAEQKEAVAEAREEVAAVAAAATVGAQHVKERPASPKQLTPLVVTEKKIISLKRNASGKNPSADAAATEVNRMATAAGGGQGGGLSGRVLVPGTKRVVVQRGRLAGNASAAVKPVVIKRSVENDSDEFDEDELLADSPPPPPAASSGNINQSQKRSLTPPTPPVIGAGSRRIVLASSRAKAAADVPTTTTTTTTSGSGKGVFDRLEKRVGVTEGAKRKLKRIVIKHLE